MIELHESGLRRQNGKVLWLMMDEEGGSSKKIIYSESHLSTQWNLGRFCCKLVGWIVEMMLATPDELSHAIPAISFIF